MSPVETKATEALCRLATHNDRPTAIHRQRINTIRNAGEYVTIAPAFSTTRIMFVIGPDFQDLLLFARPLFRLD